MKVCVFIIAAAVALLGCSKGEKYNFKTIDIDSRESIPNSRVSVYAQGMIGGNRLFTVSNNYPIVATTDREGIASFELPTSSGVYYRFVAKAPGYHVTLGKMYPDEKSITFYYFTEDPADNSAPEPKWAGERIEAFPLAPDGTIPILLRKI